MQNRRGELAGCDLVFFDPDNGLEVPSRPKGRRDSSKFLYEDEVAVAFAGGHSLLIYQHFPREERDSFVQRKASDLERLAPGARVWGIRTTNVVFFLVVQPVHIEKFDVRMDVVSRRFERIVLAERVRLRANSIC